MEGTRRPRIGDLYQSDLERHLFAPGSPPERSTERRHEPVGERILKTVQVGWTRWKELAISLYLS